MTDFIILIPGSVFIIIQILIILFKINDKTHKK
jgi:Na+/melibiose symporter-like transporter